MEIGERIRTIRKQKKIKQKDLASSVGLTVNGLQKIEYGEIIPRQVTVHKIAKALGVEYIDLDDKLKEMIHNWMTEYDQETLSKEANVFDSLPSYDEDDIETFRQFLLLNPNGKKKVSEYIDLLMQKYKTEE